jgi:hypothetical protein
MQSMLDEFALSNNAAITRMLEDLGRMQLIREFAREEVVDMIHFGCLSWSYSRSFQTLISRVKILHLKYWTFSSHMTLVSSPVWDNSGSVRITYSFNKLLAQYLGLSKREVVYFNLVPLVITHIQLRCNMWLAAILLDCAPPQLKISTKSAWPPGKSDYDPSQDDFGKWFPLFMSIESSNGIYANFGSRMNAMARNVLIDFLFLEFPGQQLPDSFVVQLGYEDKEKVLHGFDLGDVAERFIPLITTKQSTIYAVCLTGSKIYDPSDIEEYVQRVYEHCSGADASQALIDPPFHSVAMHFLKLIIPEEYETLVTAYLIALT